MKNTTVSQRGNVTTIKFDKIQEGWEQWLYYGSDWHHDNINCRRKRLRRDLKQIAERKALGFVFGDIFCAMQGKYDPRSNMADIRPEDVGANYLDRIVTHCSEEIGETAKRFVLISKGNHEESQLQRHHHCLISALVHRLNSDHGGNVQIGGIGGWVRLMYKINKTQCQRQVLYYHHGAGGGGPVTRGVIQTNRQSVYLDGIDMVVNGHTHDAWHVPVKRVRLNRSGRVEHTVADFIRTPSYKDDFRDSGEGWANVKWMPPKPIGCVWVRLYYYAGEIKRDIVVDVE